jgi:choline dehydrogenase-like flavoprotein
MDKKICVIGSGLAGGIVASKLAEEGHCVTLVERGNVPEPLIATDETWEGAEPKISFTRGTGIGGTSNFWHGGLTILDKTDIEGVQGYGRDHQSPMSYADLRTYYDRAVSLISNKQDYSLKDIELESDSCSNEFALNSETFRLKALLYPRAPFSTKTLVERSTAQHGLQVVKNFDVKRVHFSGGARVACVEGCEGQDRMLKKLHADIFVLCAGGMGSPKILLESAKLNPQLQRLPIGRFLIDHPTGFVFKAKLRRRLNLKSLFGQPRQGFNVRYGFALKADRLYLSDFRNHVVFLSQQSQ